VKFFATAAQFRAWLRRSHGTAKELVVGFYKAICDKDLKEPRIPGRTERIVRPPG
jgi:hypothetical protein